MTSLAIRARRATTSRDKGQAGFTLVELLVTMMVMGIIASSVMMVALRTFTTTATITDRRDVFADGRVALDQLSKQLRQGESIDQAASTASSITFSSYIDGAPETIIWRVTGTTAPYSLEPSRDRRSGDRQTVARHDDLDGSDRDRRSTPERPTGLRRGTDDGDHDAPAPPRGGWLFPRHRDVAARDH